MTAKRLIIASLAGALVVTGVIVAPAFGAPELGSGQRSAHRALSSPAASFGTFTPAAADPRLAAMLARGGLADDGFHFTPAETRRAARAVTVAIRTRVGRVAPTLDRPTASEPRTVGLAPIAYNMGVAVGWKRIALAGGVTHVDLAGQPGSRDTADIGVSYTVQRFTGRVKGAVAHPLADTPRLVQEPSTYSIDVGGAYRLTRNVDVTAGVRYRMDRERLDRAEDDRRDSQAVYVGTAFKF